MALVFFTSNRVACLTPFSSVAKNVIQDRIAARQAVTITTSDFSHVQAATSEVLHGTPLPTAERE